MDTIKVHLFQLSQFSMAQYQFGSRKKNPKLMDGFDFKLSTQMQQNRSLLSKQRAYGTHRAI